MSEANLSVVNISSDAYVQAVNDFAELCGCGSNSLSVQLQDSSGNIFWACHSWWKPEDYAAFKSMEIPSEYQEAMSKLYERAVLDGDPQENFSAALTELSLTIFSEET